MGRARGASGPSRRAPRLRPDEHIAPHITRRGRFLKRDPLKPAELPSLWRVLGALGWALFTAEVLRRARRLRGPSGG